MKRCISLKMHTVLTVPIVSRFTFHVLRFTLTVFILSAAIAQVESKSVFTRLLFLDQFDKGVLGLGWKWIDPWDDATLSFPRYSWLGIVATPGNDLQPKANLDAPRLIRPISGDFAIETKISKSQDGNFLSGGLLIWKDEENFIRFDRGTWGFDTIFLQKREGGLFQHVGDWFFRDNPIHLRIERIGYDFNALFSSDGKKWDEAAKFKFDQSDPLYVGLHAICFETDFPPTTTEFDYFKILSTGNEEPYKAKKQYNLSYDRLQALQRQEEKKLMERANYVLSMTASERDAYTPKNIVTDPKTGLKFIKIYSDEKLDIAAHSYWLIMSPDGKFLFTPLDASSGLSGWVIPLNEEEEPFKPVPEIEGGICGSWSSDMSEFAFTSVRTGDLFVMPISPETGKATGSATKLIDGIGEEYQNIKSACPPSWSPDGKHIAFSWGKSGNFDIWTISATGGEPTQITYDSQWERWPVWSSDGKSIVFAKKNKFTWDVWMVQIEEGTSVRIIENAYGVFSPNGKWFAFKRLLGKGFGILRLSDKRQFDIIPPKEVGEFFDWSHEGNKVLFYKSGREYLSVLKVVPVYGGPSLELGKGIVFEPYTQNWSLDGSIIVTGDWIVPARGGTPMKLKLETKPKVKMIPFLPFSPDLKKFAFLAEDESLWVIPVSMEEKKATGKVVKITEKIKSSGSYYTVGWSPDSKRIAFSSLKSGNADIWMASVEGDEFKRLTDAPEDETDPVWSPDGKMIAYNKDKALWMAPVAGSKPREVVGDGSSPTWSPDGERLGFIEGDSSYIAIMTITNGQIKRILDLQAFGLNKTDVQSKCWNLIWSPDGQKLAFLSLPKRQIWVVPVEGGEPTELANDDAGSKSSLYWSPDGKRLSYNSDRMVKMGRGAVWEADVEGFLREME